MQYHKRVRHSHAYYTRVNSTLLTCLLAGSTQSQMIATLALENLPSPTGRPWTLNAIKQVLLRLRRRQGPNYVTLLEDVFDGLIAREAARPLLQCL